MTSARDNTSRLRQTLNPLLTSALGYHSQLGTPRSAATISSPHALGLSTPASSIQPYNPQEWIPSPVVGPERMHQYPPQSAFRDAPPGKQMSMSPPCQHSTYAVKKPLPRHRHLHTPLRVASGLLPPTTRHRRPTRLLLVCHRGPSDRRLNPLQPKTSRRRRDRARGGRLARGDSVCPRSQGGEIGISPNSSLVRALIRWPLFQGRRY